MNLNLLCVPHTEVVLPALVVVSETRTVLATTSSFDHHATIMYNTS